MSSDKISFQTTDAGNYHYAIVASRYNKRYVDFLVRDSINRLNSCGVEAENVRLVRVPGAVEIPHVCSMLAETDNYDAIIALGVIIKGDTIHDEIIANSVASALQNIAVCTTVPIVNGIISVGNEEQAAARCTGGLKRGAEFADIAMEMAATAADLLDELVESRQECEDDGEDGEK